MESATATSTMLALTGRAAVAQAPEDPMTDDQAARLGDLLREARAQQQFSLYSLAAELGWPRSWLLKLEAGQYRDPSPERVARLAERLRVDPAVVDQLTDDYLARSLPTVRTYFRSKAQASEAELDELERVISEVQAKYRDRGDG